MNRYMFGERQGEHHVVDAPSLEAAIRLFKVEVLFPEKYVAKRFVESREYDSALERDVVTLRAGSKPLIPVYQEKTHRSADWVKCGVVRLEDCVLVDYGLLSSAALLTGPEADPGVVDQHPALVAGRYGHLQTKAEVRQAQDRLMAARYELQQKVHDLSHELSLLREEVSRKTRVIYAMVTYLGMNEEVVQLRDGERAPEELPVTVYQQLLYMDEEVGVWANDGIDFTQLDVFDKWVTENVDKFLYKPKAVCAFRVRRTDKNYSDGTPAGNVFSALYNAPNHRTYFLIRNGDALWRIDADVVVPETLFPSDRTLQAKLDQYKGWSDEHREKVVSDEILEHLYCFAAIQGLIDRTDVLGTRLRGAVNLLRPGGFTPDQIDLVRDAEQEYWLTDRPSWDDFAEANRAGIRVGTRVCVAGTIYRERDSGGRDDSGWRTAPFRPYDWPHYGAIYTVDEVQKRTYGGEALVIHYLPDDEARRRRVPFRFYRAELLDVDALEPDDCDYYMRNRNERRNYLQLLPTLHWIKRVKAEERELERHLVALVAGRLGAAEDLVWEVVRWWKLKNKWRRAITKDDALALRMVEREVKRRSR